MAAEKNGEKIAVETKSFVGRSRMKDFQDAVGQFLVYQGYLEVVAPERTLFLAISERVYETIFSRPAFQLIVKRFNILLVVINIQKEEVVLWTK